MPSLHFVVLWGSACLLMLRDVLSNMRHRSRGRADDHISNLFQFIYFSYIGRYEKKVKMGVSEIFVFSSSAEADGAFRFIIAIVVIVVVGCISRISY